MQETTYPRRRRRRGWTIALVVIGALVALVVIAVGIGGTLPREHVATVRARFAAAPNVIWAVLDDPYSAGAWRKDLKKVEKIPDLNGHPTWREESGMGTIVYELVESVAPVSRTTRIVDDLLPFGGQWEYRLAPAGSGTEVTITERGFVKSAFFRFMARFVFGYTSSMRDFLGALGSKLGENVTPEVVASGP